MALHSMSEFVKPTATMVDGGAQKVQGKHDIFACHTLPKFGVCFLPPHCNWPTPTVDFQSEQISGWHDDRKKLKFRVRLKICKCRCLMGSSIYDLNSEGRRGGLLSNKAKLRRLIKLVDMNINDTSFADIASGSPLPERPPVLLPMRKLF